MSDETEVSEETPEKPSEVVADEELDDVAGGAVKSAVKSPIKDDDGSFVSFPPDFLKVMAYRETDATLASSAGRSVSEIFDTLAADE